MTTVAQLKIQRFMDEGRVGQLAKLHARHHTAAFPVATASVKEAWTAQLPATPTAETEYTLSVYLDQDLAADVSVITDATPTLAELFAGFQAALADDPVVEGLFVITDNGSDTFTLTGENHTFAFSIQTANSDITLVNTVESFDGAPIAPGLAVYVVNGEVTLTKPAGSLEDVLAGVTLHKRDNYLNTPYVSGPAANSPKEYVEVAESCEVFVAGGADAAYGGTVYVGTDANAEQGQWFTAAGAGRTALPSAAAKWIGPNKLQLKLGL